VHPRHKLKYFEKASWLPEWITTAEDILYAEFEHSYAALSGVSEKDTALPPAGQKKKVFTQSLNAFMWTNTLSIRHPTYLMIYLH